MNNFKSATLLAAVSLSALSLGAAMPARAQTAASAAVPASLSTPALPSNASPASALLSKSSVAQFSAQYQVPVIQDPTPMDSVPLDSAPPTARLDALQQLAANSAMTWRKVYRVSPATAENPVTTLATAEAMVDQPAKVNLNASGIPESSAFKTIAAADNATVKYADGAAPQDTGVTLNGSNLPQVIASLAQQTHTHWQAVYLLAPVIGGSAAADNHGNALHPKLIQNQHEAARDINGPITIHFAFAPQTTATTPAASSTTATAANTPQQTANPAPAPSAAPSLGAVYLPYGAPSNINVGGSVVSTPYSVYGDNPD